MRRSRYLPAAALAGVLGAALVWLLGSDGRGDPRGAHSRGAPAKLVGAIAFARGGPGYTMLPGDVRIASGLGIFVVDLATGEQTRVTAPRTSSEMPAWSPDGRALAFARYRSHGAAPATTELARVRPDGRGMRAISTCPPARCAGDGSPAYSPDGAHLAFLRLTDRGGRIVVADRDGDSPSTLRGLAGLSVYAGPSWSPDASRIAFSAYHGDRGPIDVYVARADGTGLHRITDCRRSNCRGGYMSVAWSPIDDTLAVAHAFGRGIRLIRTDGTLVRSLTRCRGNCEDSAPAWSPDGRFIAFARTQPRGSAIYAIAADGTALRRLTRPAPYVCCPSWQPPRGTSR